MNPISGSKLHFHPDRVAEWKRAGDGTPITMELDMTNRCTDNCPCCAGGRYKSTASLETDAARRVIDEAVELGVRGLIFTGGGEPLCHTSAPATMRYAVDAGLGVGLITNGVLLNPELYGDLFRATWIRVSLDAATAGLYAKTHGTKNFERVITNIRVLAEAKRERGAETTIGVGFLVGAHTINEMEKCASLCAMLGVDYLQFRPFHETLDKPKLLPAIESAYCRSLGYTRKDYAVVWSENKFRNMGNTGRPYGKCYGQAFATVVGADGTVWLCCHMRGKEKYALGNIHENSLENIWYGDRRRDVIDSIDFRDCVPLCRCDPFNRILWNMKHNPPPHVEFL